MTKKSEDLFYLLYKPEFDQQAFESIDKESKYTFAIKELTSEAYNGGIDQYFWNPSGARALLCTQALCEIGDQKTLNYLTSCMAYFPDKKPSINIVQRRMEIDKIHQNFGCLNDILECDIDDEIFVKLKSYCLD